MIRWLRYLIGQIPRPYLICGVSMSPTLIDGQVVLSRHLRKKEVLEINGIYIYKPPDEPKKMVVKRLVGFLNESKLNYFFQGDNLKNSYDSRYYGFVSRDRVLMKVVWYRGKERGK